MHTVSQARDQEVESLWHQQDCFQRSKLELAGWVSGQVKAFHLIKAPDVSALGWLEVTGGVGGSSEEGVVDKGRHWKAGCISPDT